MLEKLKAQLKAAKAELRIRARNMNAAYKAYYRVSSFSLSFTLKSKAIAFELDVRRRVEILNTAWSADTDGAFGGESTYTYEVVLS